MVDQEQLDREIEDFMAYLIPFGSRDIAVAVETAIEVEHDGQWAAEQIEQYVEDVGGQLKDVDPVYVVYDAILQEARNDIEELTEKDILNDTEDQVYVAGNYMCTTLDYSQEAQSELRKIMRKIHKEDFTPAMKWLWSEVNL